VHLCLEVEPFQAWYYRISSNFYTVVILLQIDLTSSDEPKTVYEGFYEIENTSIFAWFSIFDIGHYCWLCGPIRRFLPNSKVEYLIHIIRHIVDFLYL
jgi:hypothetical protein